MELQQLRTFLEVSRRGSFTAAARALHRTQPAISTQLRNLERELGQRLFHRKKSGVELTEVGRRFVRLTEDWLREMEGTIEEVRIWGTVERGHLRMGTTDVPASHWLPRHIRSFLRKHSSIKIIVNVEGSQTLVEQTLRGDVELALVTMPVGREDLIVQPIHREPLVVVAPARHPLAGKRKVKLERLVDEPLILHKPESVTRRTIEAVFRAQGLQPRISMEMSHPEPIKRLVRVGLGISVLPESLVKEDLRRGLLGRVRIQGWHLERQSGLIWPTWRPLSKIAAAWVEHLTIHLPSSVKPGR
ncbi:MAG: LysR family transcriptional regulator [Candidatus Eisenbacteria bacterium]|uniref:LysR family transcriptional regulator n=1 Tax=Eiseniibacteriota bacterium TaxID=2212470 RepID=A0A948RZI7_UNCEI|nr:LysR family transcriptional regulator [Candidatus Eisenbacteria bacterium]MBU1947360.1 LysR family transcriptional regulator [Candidatus Eisenbacteria bacterium]MBU2692459.1 LysR family transcriptional regulator [Candidatus Eisenbacteria bacterium]